jgi:hypothetical protein
MPRIITGFELGRERLNSAAFRVSGRACSKRRRKNKDDEKSELSQFSVFRARLVHICPIEVSDVGGPTLRCSESRIALISFPEPTPQRVTQPERVGQRAVCFHFQFNSLHQLDFSLARGLAEPRSASERCGDEIFFCVWLSSCDSPFRGYCVELRSFVQPVETFEIFEKNGPGVLR